MNKTIAQQIMEAIAKTRNGEMTMEELTAKVEQLNMEGLATSHA